MRINKKNEEEISEQIKWFVENIVKLKVSEKTWNDILKLFQEDDWFFVRIKKKLCLKKDLYKKQDINKIISRLIKNKIEFDDLWKEYIIYTREIKANEMKEKKAKKLFEPYVTQNEQINNKMIFFIKKSLWSDEDLEKIKKLLDSNLFKSKLIEKKEDYFFANNLIDVLKYLTTQEITFFLKFEDINWDFLITIYDVKKTNPRICDIIFLLSEIFNLKKIADFGNFFSKKSSQVNWRVNKILYDEKIWHYEEIKKRIIILEKTWYELNNINWEILTKDNLEEYIRIIESCEIDNSEKINFLKVCIKYELDWIKKLMDRIPSTHYEWNWLYTSKIVEMEWWDFNNKKITEDTIKELIGYMNEQDLVIFEKLWTIYWTKNWKKNVILTKKIGGIKSTKIIPYNKVYSHMEWDRNGKISSLKKIHYNDYIKIINKLISIWAKKEDMGKLTEILLCRWNVSKQTKKINLLIDEVWIKDCKRIINADDYDSDDAIKEIVQYRWDIDILEENIKYIKSIWINLQENLKKNVKILLTIEKPENLQVIIDQEIITEKKVHQITEEDSKQLKEFLDLANTENLKSWIILLKKVSQDILEIIEILKNLFEWWLLTSINISKENIEKLQSYNPEEIKEYINLIIDTAKTSYNQDKKISMIEKIIFLSLPQAIEYLEVFQVLDESISPDVQHIKNELIDEILLSDNPKEVAQKINDIFIKNNLPLVGKIFKVFVELYKKERFNRELHKANTSPILNSIKIFKQQQALIYKDLMNITIKSGNISLREYIDIFVWIEESIKKFETIIRNIDQTQELPLEGILTEKEQERLLYFFRKLDTLYETSSGNILPEPEHTETLKLWKATVDDKKLIEYYKNIRKRFLVKEDESLYDNFIKFIRPLWYTSFEEVKQEMEKSKQQAHQRWLGICHEAMNNWWKVSLEKWDFIKGIQNTKIIESVLERWCTSREYLGWWDESWSGKACSDMTPFDIDGWSVTEELSQYNFSEILYKSVSWSYGNEWVALVIKNKRWTLYNTREQEIQWYTKGKYEVFQTWSNDHYGIRTGIPSTEIDFLIWNGDNNSKNKEFEKICYEIAKNWFYIPIVNRKWTIIFTPEMYHNTKKTFMYCERYLWYDVLQEWWFQKIKEQDNEFSIVQSNTELWEIFVAHSPNNNKYKKISEQNKELALSTMEKIKTILEEKCGIKFNSEFDTAIVWAKIHDSWSTWRGTDVPTKDVDLDFTLLLDSKDYDEKLQDIKDIIHQEVGTLPWEIHDWLRESGLGLQIKSKKNTLWNRQDGIALDLLIMKKIQVIEYSSSDAASDRLEYIRKTYGVKALEQVRTNIIIMKKLLKAKCCYKKPEWWFGGIGVENRILQHHGNFIEALESFEKVAYEWKYQEWKNPISFQEFQGKYPIYDIGENYKDGGKDNFVFRMKEKWYNWILEIIKEYRKHWLKWIEKILDEYLQKKAEFGAI